MKLKKAAALSLTLALAATGAVTPASIQAAEKDEEIVLKVHIHYDEGDSRELADYAAEKVKEKYPNVTLEFENFIGDGGQTIKTRAATGDLPDIIKVDGGTCEALLKSGNLLELDSYYEETGYAEKNLPQSVIDSGLYSSDGHIYQFPIDGIAPVLWYYNKQIFDENNIKVPTNFDELITAIEQLRELDIIPVAMFGQEPWPVGAFFDTFVLKENEGGVKALSEGTAKASDEGYTKAINRVAEAIEAGIFQDGVTNTDYDTANALFTEGKAAMFLNGSWYVADLINNFGENGMIMDSYPTGDAGETEEVANRMAGGPDTAGVAVSANTKYPEIAVDVAAIFASAREEREFTHYKQLTVPVKAEELQIEGELEPQRQTLLEKIPNFTYGSKFIHTLANTKFSTDMIEELQKLFVGESAEDFIKNVDKSIEKSLS